MTSNKPSRPGRPKKFPGAVQIAVLLDKEARQKVEAVSEAGGLSKAEAVRRLIGRANLTPKESNTFVAMRFHR